MTVAALFFAWFMTTSPAFGAEKQLAGRPPAEKENPKPSLDVVCLKMDDHVNYMLGRQISRCSPSISKLPGKYSFFFVAGRPVLNDPWDRRVWLLAIVEAVGRAMTDTEEFPALRGVDLDEVITFDAEFARQKKVLALPASVVKRISNDLHGGAINVDRAYDRIRAAATERPLR